MKLQEVLVFWQWNFIHYNPGYFLEVQMALSDYFKIFKANRVVAVKNTSMHGLTYNDLLQLQMSSSKKKKNLCELFYHPVFSNA
mmetsp:Transcript_21965/g.27565  ORF Transcript_21965/g.27565 Transcript_21965/m.27565 type:complete len:84 (-) Transcript_21965:145-396(-)